MSLIKYSNIFPPKILLGTLYSRAQVDKPAVCWNSTMERDVLGDVLFRAGIKYIEHEHAPRHLVVLFHIPRRITCIRDFNYMPLLEIVDKKWTLG